MLQVAVNGKIAFVCEVRSRVKLPCIILRVVFVDHTKLTEISKILHLLVAPTIVFKGYPIMKVFEAELRVLNCSVSEDLFGVNKECIIKQCATSCVFCFESDVKCSMPYELIHFIVHNASAGVSHIHCISSTLILSAHPSVASVPYKPKKEKASEAILIKQCTTQDFIGNDSSFP